MLLRDRRLQHFHQFFRAGFVHALVLLRDGGIYAVDMIADMLIYPVQFFLELLRRKAYRTEYADASRLADGDHHITAMGKGEDRHVDAQFFAKFGLHIGISP